MDLNALAESAGDFFDQSFGDLQEELEIIQDEGKKALLVMFETEDCPWVSADEADGAQSCSGSVLLRREFPRPSAWMRREMS